MNEYTPTTHTVRMIWADRHDGENSWADRAEKAGYEAEFDRWLEAHDAEIVKATEERIIALLDEHRKELAAQGGYTESFTMGFAIALINGENE